MTAPLPDLADLLDAAPRGVAVRREMDRVEVRLRRMPRRRAWAFLAFGLLFCALPAGGLAFEPLPGSLLFALWLAAFAGLVLALGAIVELIQERLGRTCRVTLAPCRLEIRDGGPHLTVEVETVAALGVRPWPETGSMREDRPGRLAVQIRKQRYDLLRGVPIGHLRWLAAALESVITQRKAELLAAGHDAAALAQLPPEAAALKAMTQRAGEPPRG